ncbi:MAG TPA: mandelate racemase/muconate lactonizing enzyme family protein [Gemmataceae bacterium]|nr:mandelate racemase/muconate lactonizing enzyme family protein [Gemmataceae bacterium]
MSGAAKEKTRPTYIVLLVNVETDAGITGIGFGVYAITGRALLATIEDELAPLMIGDDATNHVRLWAKVQTHDNPLAIPAYAAIDIAIWDIKAKQAGVPLWQLLGGVRDKVPIHAAETACPFLTASDTITLARSCLDQGLGGVRVAVRGIDPEADAHKVQEVRDALGEEIWFAVTGPGHYDYETALPMGRFIEEDVGADWFEDPLREDDVTSYARLSSRIDTPLAAGSRFNRADQFLRLLDSGATVILRPDLLRLGGITPWLKIAALAELCHRPVVPFLMPEIGVHLACALPGVQAVEYVPWLAPLFTSQMQIKNGQAIPPDRPGHGWQVNPETLHHLKI